MIERVEAKSAHSKKKSAELGESLQLKRKARDEQRRAKPAAKRHTIIDHKKQALLRRTNSETLLRPRDIFNLDLGALARRPTRVSRLLK